MDLAVEILQRVLKGHVGLVAKSGDQSIDPFTQHRLAAGGVLQVDRIRVDTIEPGIGNDLDCLTSDNNQVKILA